MRGPYEGKYRRLTEHLEALGDAQETMTFSQIETVLKFELPRSARTHQAWWANQDRGQSLAWLCAGFRTVAVSVDEERLTFHRFDMPDEESEREIQPLTIAEAKDRLAFTLGIHASQIDITIRA